MTPCACGKARGERQGAERILFEKRLVSSTAVLEKIYYLNAARIVKKTA